MKSSSAFTPSRLVVLRTVLLLVGLLILFGLLLVGYRLISGRSLGIREKAVSGVQLARALSLSSTVKASSQGHYTNIVFLHHSVGNNLIEQGDVHRLFREAGYSFWDQGYNNMGLRGPDGELTGAGYGVPNDNTDPDGMAVVFGQKVYDQPVNTLSGLLQHEVIIFKSCFPNSNIGSPEKAEELRTMYRGILQTVDAHPDKVFILVTTPPLNPAETNAENARRAREMAAWMTSDEYTGGRKNLFVFDFYTLLAQLDGSEVDANMLKAAYRDGTDSHPNQAANEEIAPKFVAFVVQSIEAYRGKP